LFGAFLARLIYILKVKIGDFMFNDFNNQLDSIVRAQLQARAQQALLQNQQNALNAEKSHIRNKYSDFMTWRFLAEEAVGDLDELGKEINVIKESAPKEITEKAFPRALYHEMSNKRNAHSKYIKDMEKIIPNSSSMAIADERWNELKQIHEEFKLSRIKETSDFKKKYKSEIVKLQGGDVDAPDGLQQKFGMAIKIIEDFQKLLVAKDNIIDQNKLTIDDLRIKLTDKTEESSANHTKYLEEHVKYIEEKHAVDLVKAKLGSFIGNHEGIDGHEQLTEMLGDLTHDVA
jgi:hypothetical protein